MQHSAQSMQMKNLQMQNQMQSIHNIQNMQNELLQQQQHHHQNNATNSNISVVQQQPQVAATNADGSQIDFQELANYFNLPSPLPSMTPPGSTAAVGSGFVFSFDNVPQGPGRINPMVAQAFINPQMARQLVTQHQLKQQRQQQQQQQQQQLNGQQPLGQEEDSSGDRKVNL